MKKMILAFSLSFSLFCGRAVFATNGYMVMGSGYKVGTAGAGTALPMDGTDCASNPALITHMVNHIIGSLGVFHPSRRMDTSTTPPIPAFGNQPLGNTKTQGGVDSRVTNFPDGSLGYRYGLHEKVAFGISLTGLGGMMTKYPLSRTNTNFQRTPVSDTGVFYRIVFIPPTIAAKVNDRWSLGLSLLLSASDFKTDTVVSPTDGLPGFPTTTGRNNRQSAFGCGCRIGTTFRLTEKASIGLTVATPIFFQRFTKYRDAFISTFNFPANGTLGVAYEVLPGTYLLADYRYIYYTGTKLLKKRPFQGGFGWKNQHVFMIGAQHAFNKYWIGRMGYNYGRSPIPADRSFANVIAPGIVEHHIAAGLTYKPYKRHEISLNGYFVPRKSQTDPGTGDVFSQMGKGTKISMWQFGLQLAYKHNF